VPLTAAVALPPLDNGLSVDFTVPASGAVMIRLGARMSTTSATATAYMTAAVTQGSAVYRPASDELAVAGSGAYPNSLANEFRVYGMTPGLTYTATLQYRSSAATATATFVNRFIHVEPAF
jgi:hypothetical protein